MLSLHFFKRFFLSVCSFDSFKSRFPYPLRYCLSCSNKIKCVKIHVSCFFIFIFIFFRNIDICMHIVVLLCTWMQHGHHTLCKLFTNEKTTSTAYASFQIRIEQNIPLVSLYTCTITLWVAFLLRLERENIPKKKNSKNVMHIQSKKKGKINSIKYMRQRL